MIIYEYRSVVTLWVLNILLDVLNTCTFSRAQHSKFRQAYSGWCKLKFIRKLNKIHKLSRLYQEIIGRTRLMYAQGKQGWHGCRNGYWLFWSLSCLAFFRLKHRFRKKINAREYRKDNKKWTIQRNWQHGVRRKTKQKHNTLCVGHHYACWTPLCANKHKTSQHRTQNIKT